MSATDKLIEWLRTQHALWQEKCDEWTAKAEEIGGIDIATIDRMRHTIEGEAADALAAAEAQLEALRVALAPFAALEMPASGKWTCGPFLIEHDDIRRARAALSNTGEAG